MVSEKAMAYLTERYGDKYFGWDVEDHHVREFIIENRNITYEELNRKCSDLEQLIKEVEAMQKEIGRVENESVRRNR